MRAYRNMSMKCKICDSVFRVSYDSKGYCSSNCWLQYKHAYGIGLSTGRKLTPERRIIQLANLKKYNEEQGSWNKGLIGYRAGEKHHNWGISTPRMQGANNPNWKGGVSKIDPRIRMSQEYVHWRSAVFARDDYTCRICNQHGGYLHADHIKKWSEYPELRYDVSNGRTLCQACHYKITYNREMKPGIAWGIPTNYRKVTQ